MSLDTPFSLAIGSKMATVESMTFANKRYLFPAGIFCIAGGIYLQSLALTPVFLGDEYKTFKLVVEMVLGLWIIVTGLFLIWGAILADTRQRLRQLETEFRARESGNNSAAKL